MGTARRILHLFTSLPVGGAENLLLSLLKKLDTSKYHSTICCIRDKNVIGNEIEKMGFKVLELGLLEKGGFDRKIVSAIAEVIKSEEIEIVHSHLYHANLYGRLAARRAEIPAIISIHNTYADQRKWHRHLMNRFLASFHTTAIIAGSEEIRQDIIRYDRVDPSLIQVIANSVDLTISESQLSREEARSRLGIPHDTLVFGTVGRLEEQKGHRFLIDAMHTLKKQQIYPILLLIGSGRQEKNLREQIERLGLLDQVRLLGTRRDLGDLFRSLDIFVMPSLWEGLSLAMLSAMGAGLPVVATDVGGVTGVLGEDEFGLRVEPGNAQALADSMERLINNPQERENFAKKGQQHIMENYSDANLVARLGEIYDMVVS
ncbi:MAG: glycosyltransferase [Magnetococcales bacterium]|nr:glycosyltransferase [Magnetococcales bacterium]